MGNQIIYKVNWNSAMYQYTDIERIDYINTLSYHTMCNIKHNGMCSDNAPRFYYIDINTENQLAQHQFPNMLKQVKAYHRSKTIENILN